MLKKRSTQETYLTQIFTIALFAPIIFFVLFSFYYQPVRSTETIQRVSLTTGEYSPFASQSLQSRGIASEIIARVLKEMNYEADLQFLAWPFASETALDSSTNQGVRGTFPWAKTDERLDSFYFSDPILNIQTSIFYDSAKVSSLEDLESAKDKGGTLIDINGYSYLSEINQLPKTPYLVEDNQAAFEKLLESDELLLVAEATEVGEEVIRSDYPRQQQRIKSFPVYENPFYLMLSKKNPHNRAFRNEFNEALGQIDEQDREEIRSQVLQEIDEQRLVSLHPFGESAYLEGYTNRNKGTTVFLPQGSKAVVVEWPSHFLDYHASEALASIKASNELLVKVRLFNGPMRDQVLFVDTRALHIP